MCNTLRIIYLYTNVSLFKGTPPLPRSGCQMVAISEGKVIIWGGYSKSKGKKDVEVGVCHSDMVLLSPESK